MAKISELIRLEDKYKPEPKIREDILKQGMQWLSSEQSDVLIQVDAEVAARLLDTNVLSNVHVLKAWMPHVEVLTPTRLKHELIRDLHASIERAIMI